MGHGGDTPPRHGAWIVAGARPSRFAAALLMLAVPIAAQAEARAPLLEQKLRLVERLLASAQTRHGGDTVAGSALEGVNVLVTGARDDLASGDLEEAETALDEALRQVAALSRGDRRTPAVPDARHRYRQLLVGVRAFRTAFADVVAEKGSAVADLLDAERVDALVADAERAAGGGRYDDGVRRLAEAYELLSLALSEARANETVEYRLVFESPAQEFRYEQERYKSHSLLIKLMVAERAPSAETLARIETEVAQASALDDRARQMAGSGDFSAAIRSQEAAVAHLTRALQLGGVFMPR